MKREDLARQLARQMHKSSAQARDDVDALVHRILKLVRGGHTVKLPGLGKLVSKPSK